MTEMIGKCGVLYSNCPWSYEVLQNYGTDEEYVEFITKRKKVLTYSPPKNPANTAWRDCPGCLTPREECSPDKRIPLRSCVTYECVHKSRYESIIRIKVVE